MAAKIRIEYLIDSELVPNGNDQILLLSEMDSGPFGFTGVIYWIIGAYENLKNSGKPDAFFPEKFASELIKLSFVKEFGYCVISPATKHMYKQYDKGKLWTNVPCEYICQFQWDGEARYKMEFRVAGFGDEISKSMDELKEVADIALSIAYADSIPEIVMNDTVPCKDCIVRARCVQPYMDRLMATQPCERLSEYKVKEMNMLRKKLPEWSIPLVFLCE